MASYRVKRPKKNGQAAGSNKLQKMLATYILYDAYDNTAFHNLNSLSEWRFIGGNKDFRLEKFKKLYPQRELPPFKSKCLCHKDIVENCYIEHIYCKKVLVIGNCCVDEILESDRMRIRILDDKSDKSEKEKEKSEKTVKKSKKRAREKSDKSDKSDKGQKDQSYKYDNSTIIKFGKHRGSSFAYVKANDRTYCNWAKKEENPTGQLYHFVQWLKNK